MRVASVVTRLNVGGVSPPVMLLDRGLRARGHEAILVVGTPGPGEGTLEAEAEKAGTRVVHIPELLRDWRPVRDARAFGRLLGVFRGFRPDVVATHMSKAGALGRLAARVAGVPVVVHTYHGKGFDVFTGWRRRSVLSVEQALARVATGNIVVSRKQLEEFVRLGVAPRRKLRAICYGVDLERFAEAARTRGTLRAELGLPGDALLVGVVARLVAIKGQDVFLEAVARLRASHPNVRFLLVGDGPDRARYEAINRRLRVDVHFLGWRRDMPEVLSALDVVALPTVGDFEGTPVAVIEALAARRAVVATDVGAVSEVVHEGETGLVVPPRDPDALAVALSALLDDPALRVALGCSGQRLVFQRYGKERMVEETESYYRELLDSRQAFR